MAGFHSDKIGTDRVLHYLILAALILVLLAAPGWSAVTNLVTP